MLKCLRTFSVSPKLNVFVKKIVVYHCSDYYWIVCCWETGGKQPRVFSYNLSPHTACRSKIDYVRSTANFMTFAKSETSLNFSARRAVSSGNSLLN